MTTRFASRIAAVAAAVRGELDRALVGRPPRGSRAGAAGRRGRRETAGSRRGRRSRRSAPAPPRAVGHRDRHRAVELDDRRRRDAASRRRARRSRDQSVSAALAAPSVHGRDRRLERVRARRPAPQRPLERAPGPRRSGAVPAARDPGRRAGRARRRGAGARRAARVVQQHQRQQPARLGLVRHQLGQHAAEADRLAAELARGSARRADGRRVALVEDQVDDASTGVEPLRQLVGAGTS